MFMLLLSVVVTFALVLQGGHAGMAPLQKPNDMPNDFCPKSTGTATETTGECMCHWQHKDGCQGSGCMYQMGLSWYHHTCKDCKCIPEPQT